MNKSQKVSSFWISLFPNRKLDDDLILFLLLRKFWSILHLILTKNCPLICLVDILSDHPQFAGSIFVKKYCAYR